MERDIIRIDDDKCTGCGECIPNCHEKALQIVGGKVRLVSELMCDGLGACIGHCPEGAITIESREAEPFDEEKYGDQQTVSGMETLVPDRCPGSKSVVFDPAELKMVNSDHIGSMNSQLRQWPVQLHLINPAASHFAGSDLLVAADCSAFALGDFHQKWLINKTLVIACPKLDQGKELYLQKFIALITDANVSSITVLIMEVPCCAGLLQLVEMAIVRSGRKVPVQAITISIRGQILREAWV